MFKKTLAVLLSIVFVIACIPAMNVSAVSTASLYNIYGNSMLFAQNKDAIFSGTATVGSKITVKLYNSSDKLIREASATTASNGTFKASFKAPAGSFEEYTVFLYEDEQRFAKLLNVVFGELWLASGQSNMSFNLGQEATGEKMKQNGQKLSKWLRVLTMPSNPKYNDSATSTPLNPLNEIAGAVWLSGESSDVYSMSAIAYFFADSLMDKINMPVGILNSSLSGSYICSWLSRAAIDNSSVGSLYKSKGMYISEALWNTETQDRHSAMTANYNLKIAPLKNFRPSGILWYQGESDLEFNYTPQEYNTQLTLLQQSYSELFGYGNELMPIICTQLAPYRYSTSGLELLDWNVGLVNFCESNPETRAVVSNYDLPLTYSPSVGFIHPLTKSDIGIRMAYCADSLVYDGNAPASVANVEKYKIAGSNVYISFDKNVGDGLACSGDEIRGFAICSGDGYYVPAEAEIIDKNTVKVYSDSISTPVSVTYAYCVNNSQANLYSTYNGKNLMPVSAFALRVMNGAHYWKDKHWMYCDDAVSLHNYNNSDAMYSDAWDSNTDLFYTGSAAYSGSKGLHIATVQKEFYISPVLTYEANDKSVSFKEIDIDYSDYGTFSFRIRNNLTTAITVESVDFYTEGRVLSAYYSAMNISSKSASIDIPGDGDWHEVTYDLNTLYRLGNKYSVHTNEKLKEITGIRINFSSNGSSFINVDAFSIGAEDGSNSSTDNVLVNNYPVDDSPLKPEEIIFADKNSHTQIDYEKKIIYGIETALDENGFLDYANISETVNISYSTSLIGTGTVVALKDKITNKTVAEYTIVIFGDYNGDGIIDIEDAVYFAAISNFEIYDFYDNEYLFMATDINGDGAVDIMDEECINAVANYEAYIDQTVTEGLKVFNY